MSVITSIFLANIASVFFFWGLFQFHRKDFRAPWSAYAAVLVPLFAIAITAALSGDLPVPLALTELR